MRQQRPDDTLRALAGRALAGDSSAFEALHDRLDGGLRRLLARLGSAPQQVDELSQRTWMETWKAVQSRRFDPERAAFSTFLYAVARNVHLQHRRRRAPGVSLSAANGIAASLPDPGAGPADVAQLAEMITFVRGFLDPDESPLDATDSEILRGTALGEPERTLATRLRLAPSTVNHRKRAALERLRAALAARGFGLAEHGAGSGE